MAVTYATAGVPMPDWLTEQWCEDFIHIWFNLYPKAKEYFDLIHYRARRYEIEWSLFGRVRRIPEVRSCHERIRSAGLRQAGNMPVQATAADVNKLGMARTEAMLEAYRASGLDAWALMSIHDELLLEVEEGWAEEVCAGVQFEMGSSMVDIKTGEEMCSVPIAAEGKVMDRWEK